MSQRAHLYFAILIPEININMTNKPKAATQHKDPFAVLDASLSLPSSDSKLWWDAIAPVISRHLIHTGYGVEAQYENILLIQSALIPFLGPFPNKTRSNVTWHSCIAGDSAPLDISVNYQTLKSTFRITIEPIGPYAGTDADRMNEIAPRQLLHRLGHIQPGLNLTWYDRLEEAMLIKNNLAREKWDALSSFHSKTQTLIGLDLHEGSFTVKAYFFPHLRAAATGEDWADIMFNAIRKIDTSAGFNREVTRVEAYIRSIRPRLLAEKPNIAIDCKCPADSRIKVYAAVDMSSLQNVYDFWTLGGQLEGAHIEKGFEIVKEMWNSLYSNLLPNNAPRKAMTVHCNWEFSPSKPDPVPKAYFLLTEDYDLQIIKAITTLFHVLGWGQHVRTHEAVAKEME